MEEIVFKSKKKAETKEFFKRYGMALAFISPFCLLFIVFTLIPLLYGLVISLCTYNPYDPSYTSFVGLSNYFMIFGDNVLARNFWSALGTTIVFDIFAVPCLILIPLGLAYLINLKPPGYKIFRAIIYLPSVVSITIVGVVFGAIFSGSELGLINAWFSKDSPIPFLSDEVLRWIVILLASIWWQSGTNFIIFSAALRDVPKSLYEACEMDGGNRFKTFIHVTLPNIKGSLGICLFNTLIGYLNLYGQPTVLNSAVNRDNIDTPMILIQKWLNDFEKSKLTGLICATAIFFGLIVMLVTIIQNALTKERRGRNKYEHQYEAFQNE